MANYGKVCALVVTYNRLGMLRECLDAIRQQTYKDYDMVVINNGSTDGTREFLDAQPDVISIHQENCGGAGGFYRGMKYMHEHGYDWLWMMDDDGLPHPDQLHRLLEYSVNHDIKYANALVMNRDKHDELAFTNAIVREGLARGDKFIKNGLVPFNGTLIAKQVIDTIGYIKREMYIWGDEREYTLRARKNGFDSGTVVDAIHYHPKGKGDVQKVLPGISKYKVVIKPKGRDKIFYRNLGYIDATYGKKNYLKYMIYYLLRLKIGDFANFHKAYTMGKNNDFSTSL